MTTVKINEEDLKEEFDIPDEVACPFELEHVWAWFRELDETRLKAMEGMNPITYLEIDKWATRMEVYVSPFETRAIRAMDRTYIIHCSQQNKKGLNHGVYFRN